MHICNVISVPFPPCEGIGHYVYGYCTKLLEEGHQVTVITRGSFHKTQRENLDGIEVIRAPFIPLYPFYLYLHGIFLNKIVKSLESHVDIVHIHTPLPPLVRTSLPIITTIHSPILSDSKYSTIRSIYSLVSKISARFVSYPLEMKLIASSDTITAVSASVAQDLRNYHLDPVQLCILHNGVNEQFFTPKQKKSQGEKQILYVGRMDHEKGVFDLLNCAQHLCSKRSDLFFNFVGDGRDLTKLKQKSKKMGLEDRVTFTGQLDRDKLVQMYQDADLFVFPSYHEGLPTVLLEAMSCGLPIIATDVRGNGDVIVNGENGILVPPKSPNELAESILSLVDDERYKCVLGKNARNTIEAKYTWNAVAKNIVDCYTHLCNGNSKKQGG